MPSPSARRPANEPKPASPLRLRDRLFLFLAGVSTRWPLVIVVLFVGLTFLAYLYIQDFPIRTAYLDLLPQQDPLVVKFQSIEQEMASTEIIAVLFTLSSPPSDLAEREEILFMAAERVIQKLDLDDNPDLAAASYRVGKGTAVPPELLIFRTLSSEELESLRAIAREVQAGFPGLPTIRPLEDIVASVNTITPDPSAVAAALRELTTAGHAVLHLLTATVGQQPLLSKAAGISRTVLDRPAPEDEGEPIVSRDRTRLILQIWPTRRPFDSLPYNQSVTRFVREAVSQADLDDLGVTVGIGGTYVTTVETDEIIRRDMNLVTIVSSTAVFVLVLLAFASPLLCLAAVVPVLVSALFTMAWAKIAVGGFNLLTVFLPALILGLGIDYSIHILSRYVEERSRGARVKEALTTAVRTKGSACLTAAITTAVVFSCLLLSHSRAMWEMGAIASLGILISFLTTILLTPALVSLTTRDRRPSSRKRPIVSTTALRPVYRRFLRLRPGIVAVGLILTGAVLYQATRVQFRFVSDELAPVTPGQTLLTTVTREFAGDVWLGDSFRFFVDHPDDIAPLEAELARQPLVHSTSSVRGLLPKELLGGRDSILDLPIADVQHGVDSLGNWLEGWDKTLGALRTLIVDLSKRELVAVLTGQIKLAEALSEGSIDLVHLLWNLEDVDVMENAVRMEKMSADLAVVREFVDKIADLPPEADLLNQILALLPVEMRSQYATKSGRYVVEARVTRAILMKTNLRAFLDWADGLGVERFGIPEVTAQLEEYMRRDFLLSTVLAIVIIFLLVWRDFPQASEAALALAPLAMGYVWMLAGMNLLGIQFNFTNIVISPLLIGIGVDSAVHLLHRVDEERSAGGDAAVRGAAASIVPIAVSSLTTMATFGALLAAHTPGLRLLGTSALLGLGFTLLWSLTFLPAAAATLVEKAKPRE